MSASPAPQVDLKAIKKQRNNLLSSAVHNHRAISKEGMLERLFSYMFRGFVYPQIWEDPEIDMEALRLTEQSRIFTIASGGCNVMNYLTARPARITAVDLNPAHVALTKLKLAATGALPDYETFFRFFGQADSQTNIQNYDVYLRNAIDPVTRAYWEEKVPGLGRHINYFAKNIYRYGLLGRFIGAVHLISKIYGKDPKVLLQAKTPEEQTALFNEHLAPLFSKRMVKLLCSLPISLYGLGIPPAQYKALADDAHGDVASLLKERLRHLACDFDINENYFAWQAFGRGYDRQERRAVPRYLKEDNFQTLRECAKNVDVHHISMTDYLTSEDANTFDCYIFLDAQDWMNDDQLEFLWRRVLRTARQGARVIFRTAGTDSILENRLPDHILSRFHYDRDKCREWSARDRSSIYGGFHLYTLKD